MGDAADQFSDEIGKKFAGGGYQIRFRDFDEKWIIKSGDLKK